MKFSIIIPAHNVEEHIGKVLDSIRQQSFKDYEVIVICDSCTDKTEQIAREYGANVYRADYHNEGLGRNLGIEKSKGEWLLFIDADDWYLHEFVLDQLNRRIVGNEADIIAYGIIWKHIGYVPAVSGRNGELYPHCTNKCWRRTFIGDMRFPNIRPDSDAGFHKIIMQKNPVIDIWEMPLYYYNYLREGSYSSELGRTAESAKRWWGIK